MPTPITPTHCVRHLIEIPIKAKPGRVWKAITAEINSWWLPEFRMAKGGKRVKLEAKIGGRWCEEASGGGGILWATVIGLTKGESLQVAGHVAPPWGADTWIASLDLEESDEGTLFRFHQVVMGDLTQEQADEIEHGWKWLFTDGLKAHCEAAPRKARTMARKTGGKRVLGR